MRSSSHALHYDERVAHPFELVREALVNDAVGVFERATKTATCRARALVSSLKASIAGLEIGENIVVRVAWVPRGQQAQGNLPPETLQLDLQWHAETGKALFPSMRALLLVYPLSPNETQLELHGTYQPPGGAVGNTADRLLGHRIAEASVHRFLDEVASRLSTELP